MTSPSPSTVPLTTQLSALEASCTGRVLRAGDPRAATFLGSPGEPGGEGTALVVLADCVHDIGAAVRFARRAGVTAVVIGGAHPEAAVPPDAVVIVAGALCGVDVDPGTAIARVGIGASWDTVRDAARAVGLAGPALASLDGNVGPTLAGAIGGAPTDRRAPEAVEAVASVVAAQVVDGAGRTRFRSDLTGAALLDAAHDDGQIVTAVELRLR